MSKIGHFKQEKISFYWFPSSQYIYKKIFEFSQKLKINFEIAFCTMLALFSYVTNTQA